MSSKATFEAQSIFSLAGQGIVVAGTLKDGLLKIGMKANINGKDTTIKQIESQNQTVPTFAQIGQGAGVLLDNLEKEDISSGQIIDFK